jgi:hypothetical protein
MGVVWIDMLHGTSVLEYKSSHGGIKADGNAETMGECERRYEHFVMNINTQRYMTWTVIRNGNLQQQLEWNSFTHGIVSNL